MNLNHPIHFEASIDGIRKVQDNEGELKWHTNFSALYIGVQNRFEDQKLPEKALFSNLGSALLEK